MNYNIRPEVNELKKARELVNNTLSICNSMLKKTEDFQVLLGYREEFESISISSNRLFIGFNNNGDWEEKIRFFTAKAFAESYFLSYKEDYFIWETILKTGFALNFGEDVSNFLPEIKDKKVLTEEWKVIRQEFGSKNIEENSELQDHGFSLSYYLVQQLLKDREYDEIPGLVKSDVIDAGDEIFL